MRECSDKQLSWQIWESGNSWQMGRREGDCGEACRRLASVAAGTGGMCLMKRDEPMLVLPPWYGKPHCKRHYLFPYPSCCIHVALGLDWKTRKDNGEIGAAFNVFALKCLL